MNDVEKILRHVEPYLKREDLSVGELLANEAIWFIRGAYDSGSVWLYAVEGPGRLTQEGFWTTALRIRAVAPRRRGLTGVTLIRSRAASSTDAEREKALREFDNWDIRVNTIPSRDSNLKHYIYVMPGLRLTIEWIVR